MIDFVDMKRIPTKKVHIDGLTQAYSNFSALSIKLLQFELSHGYHLQTNHLFGITHPLPMKCLQFMIYFNEAIWMTHDTNREHKWIDICE